MSSGWGSLPLLPLCHILEHLSLQDALAAMSTSRHWRNGLLMYEGRRKSLILHAKQLDRSAFLARIFKKHVRALHVHIAGCSHDQLSGFMNRIMPQFFDSLNLQEIIFIGAGCVTQTAHVNLKLDRIITESLVFKHSHSIQRLALMNCEMDAVSSNIKDKDIHDKVEYYSRGLRFDAPSAADAILSRNNTEAMMFSSLQHIIVDYDQITTETLETLSHLTMLSQLSAIVCHKRLALQPVDWRRAMTCYPNGLDVALNLISLPPRKLDEVIENVMVEGMQLTSLKVMFCKTFHTSLLKHAVLVYKATLRELVWCDAPHDAAGARPARPPRAAEFDACNVNPIILLCWQCTRLTRLVVHGYWMWQYDIIGFVRLRKSLEHLEISAVYGRQSNPQQLQASLARVLPARAHECDATDSNFIRQVNEYTEFKWKPTALSELHPALRTGATADQRSDYIVRETRRPLGVT